MGGVCRGCLVFVLVSVRDRFDLDGLRSTCGMVGGKAKGKPPQSSVTRVGIEQVPLSTSLSVKKNNFVIPAGTSVTYSVTVTI